MSLKGDRYEFFTDLSFFMNEVQTRGGIASLSTVGSGTSLDQSAALLTYGPGSSTGLAPVGVLLTDVVNYDLTRQHINFMRNEVQKGGKVTVLRKGWCVTNNVIGTPAKGDNAYLTSSGNVMPINPFDTTSANYRAAGAINVALNPYVGKFLTTLDEDGYAKLFVDL